MTMKLVGWFDHLLDEVSAMDESLVLSTINGDGYQEKGEGETLIGELPADLKQFSVFMEMKSGELEGKCRRAIEKLAGEMKNLTIGDIEMEQLAIEKAVEAANQELRMYSKLFWWGIRLEFPEAAGKNLGIRRGGILVEKPEEEDGILPMLVVHAIRMSEPDSVDKGGFFGRAFGGGGN